MWPSSVYARKSFPPDTTPPPTPVPRVSANMSVVPRPGAELELGVGGAAGVVLHLDREPEALVHLVGEAHVANRDVDRAERQPVRMVDPGRDAEAERR